MWKMFVSGWAVGSGFKSHPCYKFYSVPQMHLHVVTGVIMPYTAIFISMPWNSAFHPFIILESIHHSLCQLFREYLCMTCLHGKAPGVLIILAPTVSICYDMYMQQNICENQSSCRKNITLWMTFSFSFFFWLILMKFTCYEHFSSNILSTVTTKKKI